jgi:hypothetical protein
MSRVVWLGPAHLDSVVLCDFRRFGGWRMPERSGTVIAAHAVFELS